jgi:glucosamine 6-phosphate synthetase-like amidotransferase/phosphosugar isomerase protein
MCGILGIACYKNEPVEYRLAGDIRALTKKLLVESEVRGSDASGLCVLSDNKASLFKINLPSSDMIKEDGYNRVISNVSVGRRIKSIIGHTRMKTKGDQIYNINNHPIKANKVIGVHNGIIQNDDALFNRYSDKIERAGRVDSEIIFRLLDYHVKSGQNLDRAVINAHREMVGGYACAFIHRDWPNYLTLFTNSSPITIFVFDKHKTMVFASTPVIVRNAMTSLLTLGQATRADEILTIDKSGARINLDNGKIYEFDLGISNTFHGHASVIGY